MKKILLVAVCSLILLTGCTNKSNSDNLNNNKTNNSATQDNETKDSDVKVSNIKVTIDNKTYTLELEDNETARSFIDLLPQEYSMSELNGNEKYIYLDSSLPTNSSNPKHINSGDVMLYGDNCLVIFYKSFDTSYSYTKIGHIDNLDDLGNESIIAKFEK